MPRASPPRPARDRSDRQAAHRPDPGRPDLLAQAVGPLLGLVLERVPAVEVVHVRQHLARALGVAALAERGRVGGIAQQQVGVEDDRAEVEAYAVLVRRDVAVRRPRLRGVEHPSNGGEQDREPVPVRAGSSSGQSRSQSRARVTTRPRCAARILTSVRACFDRQAGSGTSAPSTVTVNGPRTAIGHGAGRRSPTPRPPGTWTSSRRRKRAASRARDRSVPSASGNRPISTSTRATAGPAPPADQIDSASVSASRARAGSSTTVASSSRASASRSDARTARAAATARAACSAAAARSPRTTATRPADVSASGSRSRGASRSASAAASSASGVGFVGCQQGLAGQRRHQHLHVAGAAGELHRLGVGGAALLLVAPRPVDVGRPDQAQGRPGRSQPAAQGDRALEVPERLVQLPGAGECLTEVVQRRACSPGGQDSRAIRAASRAETHAWS